jgi:hypothetical protein
MAMLNYLIKKRTIKQRMPRLDKNMNYGQASHKYPGLKPMVDTDKDGRVNLFDCRPLNKKKHSASMMDEGKKTIFLTDGEYMAFKLVRYGKEMKLQPMSIHKELKAHGLTSDEMRTGVSAYAAWENGAEIQKGIPEFISRGLYF